jgi:hypothetical protein
VTSDERRAGERCENLPHTLGVESPRSGRRPLRPLAHGDSRGMTSPIMNHEPRQGRHRFRSPRSGRHPPAHGGRTCEKIDGHGQRLCRPAVRKGSAFPRRASKPFISVFAVALPNGKAKPFRTAGRQSRWLSRFFHSFFVTGATGSPRPSCASLGTRPGVCLA